MPSRSRRYQQSRETVDRSDSQTLTEALDHIKQMAKARFDETVECAVRLGIDARHSDQQVRGTISLPHGTGQERRVAVFAEGEQAEAAREAGADLVGSDDLIAQVNDGFSDFDVALAAPSMMGRIGRLGRFLGPRGLMPSPKGGTVREDLADAVREFKAGRIEFRSDSGGNVHVPVGKLSFRTQDLAENVQALLDQLTRMRPPTVKGRFFASVHVCSTMNPAVPVKLGTA